MSKISTVLVALAILQGTAAMAGSCSSHKGHAKATSHSQAQSQDIVETAVSAGSFSTLVAAVQAAGLVDALKGEGPFTVFAPTDDAFSQLAEGTLESLLKPENKDQLVGILTYHVVPGKLGSARVAHEDGAATLNGQRVSFSSEHGKAMVDDANIVKADIHTSNGVIHVIDNVILPSSESIVEVADKSGMFSTLLKAASEAGLAGTLQDGGPFTVLAPTDDAFAKLPDGTLDSLLKPENKDQLADILKYHVIEGRVYADEAIQSGDAATLLGETVHIREKAEGVHINDAKVVKADIDASNGVIHVIDQVILPN